jgi:glycerate-2-kinase
MTRDAMQIIQDAIQAVDPYTVIQSNIVREDNTLNFKQEDLKLDLSKDYDKIILVAFGKASSAMSACVLEQIFPKNSVNSIIDISCKGVVICKDGHATQHEKDVLTHHGIEIYEASHPVPDGRSVKAADRLIEMVSSHASDRTLVICCISGGGSSLFCRPSHPLTIDDLQQVNSVLLASGMGIQEMNVLRKRLEDGKGGRLAASCFPSHVVALILSDVIGDPLDLIASGPTVPDKSTWENGWDIVKQYKLEEKLPRAVVEMFQKALDGKIGDSPSSSHPIFEKTKNLLVGNNALAVEAAADTAKMLGYQPVVLGTEIEGEAKEVAKMYTAMSSYLQNTLTKKSDQPASDSFISFTVAKSLPVALIAGGGMS